VTANLWVSEEHALAYLRNRESLPHRVDALEVLCELLPARVERILDLGTGDGVTLALVLAARPDATGVGLDFGEEMLGAPATVSPATRASSSGTTISNRRCRPISALSTPSSRVSPSTIARRIASRRSTARCSRCFAPAESS
jgi:hypothetical protein